MTLEELLSALAVELGATVDRTARNVIRFKREEKVFGIASADALELRLDPDIAEAALRTPSTAPSEHGPDWVRLTVRQDDENDLDRARAWFLSAWRNAGG